MNKYLEWLAEKTGLDYREYSNLLNTLYSIPFRWNGQFPLDKNRASAGIVLRYDYEEETGEHVPNIDLDCSVLEVLIALSYSIDGIIGIPGEDHSDQWFQEMLMNLGCFHNEAIREIIDNWLDRKFDYFGNGSPFPLSRASEDQRDLTIWDQMTCYLNENYIEGYRKEQI